MSIQISDFPNVKERAKQLGLNIPNDIAFIHEILWMQKI